MPITYLYPPASIARGHLEVIGKNDFIAIIKLYRPNNGDEFILSAADPVHAREKAEMLCQKLGLFLATFSVSEKAMEEFKSAASYERIAGQLVKPDYPAKDYR